MSTHPGKLLAELIKPETQKSFAARLGVSHYGLWKLLNERQRVGPRMAERLAKTTGKSARYWLMLQLEHDLAGRS